MFWRVQSQGKYGENIQKEVGGETEFLQLECIMGHKLSLPKKQQPCKAKHNIKVSLSLSETFMDSKEIKLPFLSS